MADIPLPGRDPDLARTAPADAQRCADGATDQGRSFLAAVEPQADPETLANYQREAETIARALHELIIVEI